MSSLTQKKVLHSALIALFTATIVNLVFYFGLLDGLELKAFDLRTQYNNSQPSSDVAIILVDEASLRGMNPIVGRWPWPRSVHADVVDFLAMGGAKAVMFDILFTENERVSGARKGVLAPGDMSLVESTASAGNVYHAAQIVIDDEDEYNNTLLNRAMPEDFISKFSVEVNGVPDSQHNNYYLPFKELYTASKGVGIVEFLSDSDGIYRRTKLFRNYKGSYYPVLPMAPLLDILKPASISQEGDRIILNGINEEYSQSGTLEIPLQKDGSYLVNMHSGFKPYSMSGVLSSVQKIKLGELESLPVSPDEFKDKVVFIGGSAVGIEDLKPTSMGGNTPGVYLHAAVFSDIIRGDFLRYPGKLITAFSIFAFSIMVTVTILWSRNMVFYQLVIPFLIAFTYIAISFWWFKHNILIDVVAPTLSIVIAWMGSFAFLSITEGKDKRKIKKMLSQYVSPSILATLVDKSPSDVLKAEVGSKENLTVLFSDIRGFTSISERLEPEKVVELLNGYLSEMVDVIFEHEGTLDKFIGDAIMAFWGAPLKVDDHGVRAVLAALDMRRQLDIYNQRLDTADGIRLEIGIGINTGEVILGNIGSEKKLDYTIIGDNVNLASRMEGLTKMYGAPILITESTYEEIKNTIPCRIVDMVKVVGKKKGVRIFEPVDVLNGEGENNLISLSEEGFENYLKRNWDAAMDIYSKILSFKPDDKTSKIFLTRCTSYKAAEPPADWDGAFTLLRK
jgi:adenylate cyclase